MVRYGNFTFIFYYLDFRSRNTPYKSNTTIQNNAETDYQCYQFSYDYK
jgi:hypothetical protein